MTKFGILALLVAAMSIASVAAADVLVTTSLVGPTAVVVGEEASWDVIIQVATDVDITGVTVKDGMGADLDEIVVGTPTIGVAEAVKMGKGKMGATMVTWEIGDMLAGTTATLTVTVTTGHNPSGKHEFTTIELMHELDGGASAAYTLDGIDYETPAAPVE
jgi:hypothetical protein